MKLNRCENLSLLTKLFTIIGGRSYLSPKIDPHLNKSNLLLKLKNQLSDLRQIKEKTASDLKKIMGNTDSPENTSQETGGFTGI